MNFVTKDKSSYSESVIKSSDCKKLLGIKNDLKLDFLLLCLRSM